MPERLAAAGCGRNQDILLSEVAQLLRTGRAGAARERMFAALKPVPPGERCPFLLQAHRELLQGRPEIALRHLAAAAARST